MPMDRAAIEALLAEPRLLLFTANRTGGPEPFAAPVWYLFRDNRFFISTGLDNAKSLIVRRDPAVTLCVQQESWPYKAVLVRGVAAVRPGRDAALLRETSVRYLGRAPGNDYADYNLRVTTEAGSATIVVTPVAWCAWDFADGWHPEACWTPDADLR
jgi:nitroimidazol reductase NimA-like FMN-containing flavoprotein (pyridoxamine 5'-phosphate oxidase superfamily)